MGEGEVRATIGLFESPCGMYHLSSGIYFPHAWSTQNRDLQRSYALQNPKQQKLVCILRVWFLKAQNALSILFYQARSHGVSKSRIGECMPVRANNNKKNNKKDPLHHHPTGVWGKKIKHSSGFYQKETASLKQDKKLVHSLPWTIFHASHLRVRWLQRGRPH